MKRFDAETFNKQPAKAYRAADLGEEVYITHAHYPDKVFVLSAKLSLHSAEYWADRGKQEAEKLSVAIKDAAGFNN